MDISNDKIIRSYPEVMSLVPYCIRSNETTAIFTLCQNNAEQITFEYLKIWNITGTQLFEWQAPIDIIDLYEKYLEINDDLLSRQIYCNCTGQWFGSHCQFTFESNVDFETIIKQRFDRRYINQMQNINYTCYMDLQCTGTRLCLDWRQICNGIIDCNNAEDEQPELCLQLESNECNSNNEYRCQSGMCIDRIFAFDLTPDCLDHSDEEFTMFGTDECIKRATLICEEYNCASWMNLYSNEGECFSVFTNQNFRSNHYYKSLFVANDKYSVEDNKTILCRKCLICYNIQINEHFIIPKDECGNILVKLNGSCYANNICNNISFFLYPQPFMYPSVNFFYTSIHEPLPTYICYNSSQCPGILSLFNKTIIQEKFSCVNTNDYLQIYKSGLSNYRKTSNYQDLFVNVRRTLASCLPSSISKINGINYQALFYCSQTYKYISKYRLHDLNPDCLFNEDEKLGYSRNDICLLNQTNYRFKCITSQECIQQKSILTDKSNDCRDKSNTLWPVSCTNLNDIGCQLLHGIKIPIDYFLFQEICNGFVNDNLIDDFDKNETDETNCDEWQHVCSLRYSKSNCPNPFNYGRDYPFNSNIDTKYHISYCRINYPTDYRKIYRCSNICITIEQMCDGRRDCLFNEDEQICPNRINSNCPEGMFYCSSGCFVNDIKCYGSPKCTDYKDSSEDQRYCDLIPRLRPYKSFSFNQYNQYPQRGIIHYEMNPIQQKQQPFYEHRQSYIHRSLNENLTMIYGCHRGILVYSVNNSYICFCSPAYFGDKCQYQQERLTVFLRLETKIIDDIDTYKILIHLQTSTNMFYDYIDFTYINYNTTSPYKTIVYLLTPGRHQQYSVNIDIFRITKTNVFYHSSYYYPVTFTFLPVNRLAKRIIIEDQIKSILCSIECSLNSRCMSYANDQNKHFCLCNPGWTGDLCNQKIRFNCSSISLPYHSKCICPLDHFGINCYIKLDLCRPDSCEHNSTCLTFDIKSRKIICFCQKEYFGDRCQYSAAKVHIQMKNLWNDPWLRTKIPVMLVHFVNISNMIGLSSINDRVLFKDLPFDTIVQVTYKKYLTLPTFIIVQIYFNTDHDISYGNYYLIGLSTMPISSMKTSIFESNQCPYVGDLIKNSTIMQYSYLHRVKYYHRACFTLGTRCFYDERYFCICDTNAYFDCFVFNHSDSSCSHINRCLNGGYCLQPMQPTIEFACVCPKCYYGSMCQFTTQKYSISIDSLLGPNILSGQSLVRQPTIIKLILSMIIIMFIFGLIGNVLSIIIFSQPKTREIGCGLYLQTSSMISLFNSIVFLFRFAYFLITQIEPVKNVTFIRLTCISLEFLLSILPSIFDWLTVSISIERCMIVIKGVCFDKKKSVKFAKYVIAGIVSFNILLSLHEIFYFHIIDDPSQTPGHYWCVAEYKQKWIEVYEQTTNIFNLIVPFSINLLTIIILLIITVRRKVQPSINIESKSIFQILKVHLSLYKTFIISPFFIILFALPRVIFSFSLTCIQFEWQKYLYLSSYLIAQLLSMLILPIFVMTKESYQQELKTLLIKVKTRYTPNHKNRI